MAKKEAEQKDAEQKAEEKKADAHTPEADAHREASEEAGDAKASGPAVQSTAEATDARTKERYEAAEKERNASVNDDDDGNKLENNPDEVLDISDSDRKEIAERYEWQNRVAAEKERFLRLYQQGVNPLTAEPVDEEAAEEVRKDPAFAALNEDRSRVQNLSEGLSEDEAASVRREQRVAQDSNSQDDTVQRSNLRVEQDAGAEEDPQELNADELVDKIKEAGSAEEVDRLAGDDDRKTVKEAAKKRKDQLS